jgi:hypothetical protein
MPIYLLTEHRLTRPWLHLVGIGARFCSVTMLTNACLRSGEETPNPSVVAPNPITLVVIQLQAL